MSLKKNIKKGVLYTGISKYLSVLMTIIIGAILARLLSHEDFGILAIVTVFVTFLVITSTVKNKTRIIEKKISIQILHMVSPYICHLIIWIL